MSETCGALFFFGSQSIIKLGECIERICRSGKITALQHVNTKTAGCTQYDQQNKEKNGVADPFTTHPLHPGILCFTSGRNSSVRRRGSFFGPIGSCMCIPGSLTSGRIARTYMIFYRFFTCHKYSSFRK